MRVPKSRPPPSRSSSAARCSLRAGSASRAVTRRGCRGATLETALQLDAQALAGEQFLDDVSALVYGQARGDAFTAPDLTPSLGPPDTGASVESLDELLGALAEPLLRLRSAFGMAHSGETLNILGEELVASPRIGFGWFGNVVHPGPRFSAQDENLERGGRGEPVPGLAAAMNQLGYLGLFGRALGVGVDATLLRVLAIEERSGQHLGVPFSGTVFWCDGVAVSGRAARAGASLAGAALHEGYWIDIAVLREERDAWAALAKRFAAPADVQEALVQSGLPVLQGDRATLRPILGEGSRVRLQVLHDRGRGDALGRVVLGELVESTAVHEEGHLCDRTRFYPLSKNLFGILRLALGAGFSPQGIQERLEYRAQLVALCEVRDPRLPLADILSAAESGGDLTPHAAGYTELAKDLLRRLDQELEADPAAWPRLDPVRRLVHQLHRLPPEDLRALCVRQARAVGVAVAGPRFSLRGLLGLRRLR